MNSPRKGVNSSGADELESAQAALGMAKERVVALEASNDSLKVQLGERTVAVTKQKLQEAQAMLQDKLLTDDDFAAIKRKYMQENFGVSADAN